MRKLYLFTLSLLVSLTAFSQSQKLTLYGNFVYDRVVFRYEYTKDAGIHSLKLSTLNKSDVISALDIKTIDSTVKQFEALKNVLEAGKAKDTLNKAYEIMLAIQHLRKNKELIRPTLIEMDSLVAAIQRLELDSTTRSKIEKKNIYDFSELVSKYKAALTEEISPAQTNAVPFDDFTPETFRTLFTDQLIAVATSIKGSKLVASEQVAKKADEIFYTIKARADFADDAPVTAFLNLKKSSVTLQVPIRLYKSNEKSQDGKGAAPGKGDKKKKKNKKDKDNTTEKTDTTIAVQFNLHNVSVEFEDGSIKHIFADLIPQFSEYAALYGTTPIRFRNLIPISVSGKFDPDAFGNHKIFVGNSRELMATLYAYLKRINPALIIHKEDFTENENRISFQLSEFLDYLVVPENNNEDYSPANCVVSLSPTKTTIELKKERRSKILDARIYTDFVGLDDENPNGLVQVEVSRKINILTGRRQLKGYFYHGGFTYIRPRLAISKIEEDNRYYLLDTMAIDRQRSMADSQNHFIVNPLEIVRYQQWNIGLDINLYTLYAINKKVNLQINGSADYARTSIADSIKISDGKINTIQSRNISRVNSTVLGASAILEVKPDSRWGISFGQDVKWQKVFDNRFEYDPQFNRYFLTSWLHAYLTTNKDTGSNLFFRFKKNWLYKNAKFNFYQVQLGYQLDLFKTNK